MDNKRSFATGTNVWQLNCSFNSSWLSKITWIYDQLSNISGSITENQYKEINEGAVLNPTIIAFEEQANDGFERIGGCNDKLFFQEPFREYEFTESQQFITKHISMKCWMHKELPIEQSRLDWVPTNNSLAIATQGRTHPSCFKYTWLGSVRHAPYRTWWKEFRLINYV